MFIRRFQVAKLFGIPIRLDLSWFIIVVLLAWSLAQTYFPAQAPDQEPAMYWTMGFVGAVGLFVSVLLHEFGHALVARSYGIRMNGITLFIFGGVAEMQDEPPSAVSEFFVAIGGPVVTVVLVGVFGAVSVGGRWLNLSPLMLAVSDYLAVINGFLFGFNMIPAFPLDGGRVLRSILWSAKGSLTWATRISSMIGSAFGMGLIFLGVAVFVFVPGGFVSGIWLFIIGLFLRGAAGMSYQQLIIRKALEGETVRRFMKANVITVPPDITLDELLQDYVYRHHHKMYPVVENGRVVGCITMRQLREVNAEARATTRVGDVADDVSEQNTIAPDVDAMQAMSRMNRTGQSRLMVMRDGSLEGVIALKDLMEFLSLRIELEDSDRDA